MPHLDTTAQNLTCTTQIHMAKIQSNYKFKKNGYYKYRNETIYPPCVLLGATIDGSTALSWIVVMVMYI